MEDSLVLQLQLEDIITLGAVGAGALLLIGGLLPEIVYAFVRYGIIGEWPRSMALTIIITMAFIGAALGAGAGGALVSKHRPAMITVAKGG